MKDGKLEFEYVEAGPAPTKAEGDGDEGGIEREPEIVE